jgi:hypothetical protein
VFGSGTESAQAAIDFNARHPDVEGVMIVPIALLLKFHEAGHIDRTSTSTTKPYFFSLVVLNVIGVGARNYEPIWYPKRISSVDCR